MLIQRGATDLKKSLADAQKGGQLLVVAYMQHQGQLHADSSPLIPLLQRSIVSIGQSEAACVLLAVADVAGSAANAGLAGALKVVAPLPCLHIYQVRCMCLCDVLFLPAFVVCLMLLNN